MTPKFVVRFALIASVLGVFAATLAAQQVEIYPNAGFYWPSKTDIGKIEADGIYGIKAGMFMDQNVQVEGSFGYLNHFENGSQPNPFGAFGFRQPSVYGLLYDVNGSWNFGSRSLVGHRVTPFITLGAGGLTAYVKHADTVDVLGGGIVINPITGRLVPNPGRSIVMDDGDTFLTFNYGGPDVQLWRWRESYEPLGTHGLACRLSRPNNSQLLRSNDELA
jgi:hypothetical protein